jgi:hypothetical protein
MVVNWQLCRLRIDRDEAVKIDVLTLGKLEECSFAAKDENSTFTNNTAS